MATISDGMLWESPCPPSGRVTGAGFLRPQRAVEGAVADGFVEMRLADLVVAGAEIINLLRTLNRGKASP